MSSPRFVPRGLLAKPERFGRAGADWAGWEHRDLATRGHPVAQEVAGAAAWAQHQLAVRLRRTFGYPSADDPELGDQALLADEPWGEVILAHRKLEAFADSTGFSDATLTDKLSGRTLASHLDLHQWAAHASTTLAEVLSAEGPFPSATG